MTLGTPLDADPAPFVGVGFRASTVLQLWDVDAHVRLLADDAPLFGADLGVRLHPLFPFLFHESAWVDLLAAFHVRVGLGGQGGEAGARLIWTWGLGLDTPLGDPDRGDTWWVGAEFGHFGGITHVEGLEPGDLKALSVTLEYRVNGL